MHCTTTGSTCRKKTTGLTSSEINAVEVKALSVKSVSFFQKTEMITYNAKVTTGARLIGARAIGM